MDYTDVKRYSIKTFSGLMKYVRAGATDKELAAALGVQEEGLLTKIASFRGITNEEHVRELIDKNRELGKLELREAMFKKAVSGDKDLMKFLAKNTLGMSDNPNDKKEDSKGGVTIYLPDNERD